MVDGLAAALGQLQPADTSCSRSSFGTCGDKDLLLSESARDKPAARVCSLCCVCYVSKITTLHKSPAIFSSWHQAGGQIQARSWIWNQRCLGMGTRSCLRSFPPAAECSPWALLREERMERAPLSPVLQTSRDTRPQGQKDVFDLEKGAKGRVFLNLLPFSIPSPWNVTVLE